MPRVAATSLALLAAPVMAAPASTAMTLSQLQQTCGGTDDASRNACHSFIVGVAMGAQAAATQLGQPMRYCVPETVLASSITTAVKQHMMFDLLLNPTDGEMPAVKFILETITKSYSCRSSGTR